MPLSYTLWKWLKHLVSIMLHIFVEGGHPEDMTVAWLTSWTQAIRGLSPSPLYLGMCIPLAFPALEAAQEHSPEKVLCCWDHMDSIHS